jgi:hypothetical protein
MLVPWTSQPNQPICLPEDETRLAEAITRHYERQFRKQRDPVSPWLAAMVEGVMFAYLRARRADIIALQKRTEDSTEDAAQARERLRRSIMEFEDALGPKTVGRGKWLGEEVRPLLKRAEGVIEEAMAMETEPPKRRTRKRAAKPQDGADPAMP